uniref:Uncharacterized protein n=1 Tax=Leersia perrieri TaxID=77586 RepID=A0A0D9V248_9ORYZ
MARPHPHPAAAAATALNHHRLLHSLSSSTFLASSPVILNAAWITALVAVCLALCTIHSRKPPSKTKRAHGTTPDLAASTRRRSEPGEGGGASSTPAAKVSPTPSDTAKAANGRVAHTQASASASAEERAAAVPVVTVIDVGTHGPIAPAYCLPAPDPIPPRRSLSSSVKHIRIAERLGSRIRSSRRWGWDDHDGHDNNDDDGDGETTDAEGSTLWTKTIILGDRCRVGEDDEGVARWKSYRPRQPRSVPMTRSNSFAGVATLQGGGGGGAARPAADDVPFYLGRRGSLPT